ncbi:hypothetical protein PYCC9005_001133 [Savitreella phatthalungensis]
MLAPLTICVVLPLATADNRYVRLADSSWPLERISQAPWSGGPHVWDLGDRSVVDLNFHYTVDYDLRGRGVNVYVLSNGVDCQHRIMLHRAICPNRGDFSGTSGSSSTEEHSSRSMRIGTAAASVVCGDSVGSAASILRLSSTRVATTTALSTIIRALQYLSYSRGMHLGPMIVLLTIQLPRQDAVAAAIRHLYERAEITIVVHAAHQSMDACDNSLIQSMDEVITVSGTDAYDRYISETTGIHPTGNCIDILAPAVNVPAAYYDAVDKTLLAAMNHTILAAGLTTGVIATWLEHFREYNPVQVRRLLQGTARHNQVRGVPEGVPNLLIRSLLPPWVIDPHDRTI